MGTKVYFLVETDESNADPLSRMMTQMLDQMKTRDSRNDHSNPPPENVEAIFSTVSSQPIQPFRSPIKVCHVSKPKFQFKELVAGDCSSTGIGKICFGPELSCGPKNHGVKAAIVAEATVDSSGQAKAKISVNSDAKTKDDSVKIDSPARNVYTLCEKRNGLEPTLAELRGKKLLYLPIKTKLFENRNRSRCVNGPSILYDSASSTSLGSRYSGYYSNRQIPIVAEMKRCARNIPEARLIKYNACVSRRDGMQDKCDPVSRKALKKCWKSC